MQRRSFRSHLLRILLLTILVVAGVAAVLVLRLPYSESETPQRSAFDAALIESGAQLAAIGNCETCHTAPDGARYAGGRSVGTPFGVIYSTNITPDRETGIGAWSQEAFARAMRDGVRRDGAHLYPAFPYDHFTHVTDADIKALYAYAMTREPVRAENRKNELAFPFNVRPLLAGWKLLYLKSGKFAPDTTKSAEWNRGAYLVEGLAHCGACHTPRNGLGAEKSDAKFAGADADGWDAPALNANSPAPIPWDADHMFVYLRQGFDGRHGAPAGPMAPVVHNLSRAAESDVKAIATYMVAMAGEPSAERKAKAEGLLAKVAATPVTPQPAGGRGSEGADIYWGACAQCHEPSGTGVPFSLSTTFSEPSPRNAVHIIIDGIHPPIGQAGPIMPSFSGALTDAQIAAVVTYLRATFSDRPAWTNIADEIRRARSAGQPSGPMQAHAGN
jgi:mono/diheme cytochrome c family protein